MSWNDSNPGGGYGGSMGNPGGGVGGSGQGSPAGGAGGGGRGSSYGFRRTEKGIGNWNTGRGLVGVGSMERGIRGFPQANVARPQATPAAYTGPMVAPPAPSYSLPAYEPVDVWGPTYPMDPGVIAHMLGSLNKPSPMPPAPGTPPAPRNPNGNYPAQFNGGGPGNSFTGLDPSRQYGNDRFGASFGGRNPGMGGPGAGRGFGGGGGGGW